MGNTEYTSTDYSLLKNTVDLLPQVVYKNMALWDRGALDSGIIPCKNLVKSDCNCRCHFLSARYGNTFCRNTVVSFGQTVLDKIDVWKNGIFHSLRNGNVFLVNEMY